MAAIPAWAANALTIAEDASGLTTFTFDANGKTQVENVNGQLTTYTWSAENMCVGIALPSGALNTFAYDADLKRRQAEDSSGLAGFINDLENVLLETDAGGTTQVAYTLEPATYGNLISQRRSGATSFHHFDALGSTERLTDAGQAALATYLNTAFGVPVVATGAHPNRLRWLGRVGYSWEPEPAQYHVRRRRFEPTRGAWLASDPLKIGSNWRTYAGNRPPVALDPSGTEVCITLSETPPGAEYAPTIIGKGYYTIGPVRSSLIPEIPGVPFISLGDCYDTVAVEYEIRQAYAWGKLMLCTCKPYVRRIRGPKTKPVKVFKRAIYRQRCYFGSRLLWDSGRKPLSEFWLGAWLAANRMRNWLSDHGIHLG